MVRVLVLSALGELSIACTISHIQSNLPLRPPLVSDHLSYLLTLSLSKCEGQFAPKISYCLAYTTCICAFVSVLVEITKWLFVKLYCSYSIQDHCSCFVKNAMQCHLE